MTTDKTQLIHNCIKGKRRAQEAFYDLYKTKLFGICVRYARNPDDANDIFQDSFIKIFNQLKTIKNPEAIDSWVRQAVVRTAINFYHRNIKNKVVIEIEGIEIKNDEYKKIISKLSNEELVRCIGLLPDGYRMVFNLYVIDGYSHKEIARFLNISENTSKSQLRSAKLKLREILDKMGIKSYEKVI